jgi:hypothetical protein
MHFSGNSLGYPPSGHGKVNDGISDNGVSSGWGKGYAAPLLADLLLAGNRSYSLLMVKLNMILRTVQ